MAVKKHKPALGIMTSARLDENSPVATLGHLHHHLKHEIKPEIISSPPPSEPTTVLPLSPRGDGSGSRVLSPGLGGGQPLYLTPDLYGAARDGSLVPPPYHLNMHPGNVVR